MLTAICIPSGKALMSVNLFKAKYHQVLKNRWCWCDYRMIIAPWRLAEDDLLEHLKGNKESNISALDLDITTSFYILHNRLVAILLVPLL